MQELEAEKRLNEDQSLMDNQNKRQIEDLIDYHQSLQEEERLKEEIDKVWPFPICLLQIPSKVASEKAMTGVSTGTLPNQVSAHYYILKIPQYRLPRPGGVLLV